MDRKNLVLIEWPAYWLGATGGDQAVKSNAMYAIGERKGDKIVVLVPCASGEKRATELMNTPGQLETAMEKNCHATFVSRALKIDYMTPGGPGQPTNPPVLTGERPKPPVPPFRKDPVESVGLGKQFTEAQKKIAALPPAPATPAKKKVVDPPPLF